MRYLLLVLFILLKNVSWSQIFPIVKYPKGYFRNPLNIPLRLSGNFGELRMNHYHMGLDIKTRERENLPVYAAADGYIARIKIEPGGFGRAIYINHANGYTTLYAHLNNFNHVLEKWVKQQQYQKESWSISLEVPVGRFPVKKGDFLAYSGSTGGSEAPHLHFEIRKTGEDLNLNPLLFGLPITDKISPRIIRLAVYDRTSSIYEQSPHIYKVKNTKGAFSIIPLVIPVSSPRVSFAVSAFDMVTAAFNHYGIFESDLFVDGKPVIGFQLNNISYIDTRRVNGHIDYKTRAAGGPYFQHLSELPGYINSIYKKENGNGVINLSDQAIHSIKILVKDAYRNLSILNFKVQFKEPAISNLPVMEGKMFYPGMLDGLENDECDFFIGERCLYDSVHIRYNKTTSDNPISVSAVHAIGSTYIPLQEPFLIRIKADRPLTDEQKRHTVMQWYAGTKTDVQKLQWQNDWASASFRDFGFYQLLVDEEPPVIVPIGFTDGADLHKAAQIAFTLKDNLFKFGNVRTELDGKWLRFTNDKGLTFIYKFDEKCLSGLHQLKITAEDEAGNLTTKVYSFTR